jgi:hypothetical protein
MRARRPGYIAGPALALGSALLAMSGASARVVRQWPASSFGAAPIQVVVGPNHDVVVRTSIAVFAEPLDALTNPSDAKPRFATPIATASSNERLTPDGRVLVDLEPNGAPPVNLPAATPLHATGAPGTTALDCQTGLHARFDHGRWAWQGWLETWVVSDTAGVNLTVDDVQEIPTLSSDCGRAYLRSPDTVTVIEHAVPAARTIPASFGGVATSDAGDSAVFLPGPGRNLIGCLWKGHLQTTDPGLTVAGATISDDGTTGLAWSPLADLAWIDIQRCEVVRRAVAGQNEAPPTIASARLRGRDLTTVAFAGPSPVILQLGPQSPSGLCAPFPFSHVKPSGSMPEVPFAVQGAALVFSFDGLATLRFDPNDRCGLSIGLTARPKNPASVRFPFRPPRPMPPTAQAQVPHGWPIAPPNAAHPVGTTIEYVGIKNIAMHDGIDVTGRAYFSSGTFVDNESSDVVAEPGGTIFSISLQSAQYETVIVVDGNDGNRYMYGHLQPGSLSYTQTGVLPGGTVAAGARLGGLAHFAAGKCGFDHLHYNVMKPRAGTKDADAVNPLESIAPRNDTVAPTVDGVYLITLKGGQTSEVKQPDCISADTDLIASIWDLGDADGSGSIRVGVRQIATTVAPATGSGTALTSSWEFSTLELGWKLAGVKSMSDFLRFETPHNTITDYCDKKVFAIRAGQLHYIQSGQASNAGSSYQLPEGNYLATIDVEDFNHNRTHVTKAFCVGPSTH